MNYYNNVHFSKAAFAKNETEQEHCLTHSIKELQKVNKKLAKLSLEKETLTNLIIGALEHDHEGQKSYEHEVWKIEVKTPFIYSLNKKEYESGKFSLPSHFNPIREAISYSIDKKLCEKYLQEAPENVFDALVELIDKKPGKASVTIKERIA